MFTTFDVTSAHASPIITRDHNGIGVSLSYIHAAYDNTLEHLPANVVPPETMTREVVAAHEHRLSFNISHRLLEGEERVITEVGPEMRATRHGNLTDNFSSEELSYACAAIVLANKDSVGPCFLAGSVLWLELVRSLALAVWIPNPDAARKTLATYLATLNAQQFWPWRLSAAVCRQTNGSDFYFAYRSHLENHEHLLRPSSAIDRRIYQILPWRCPEHYPYHEIVVMDDRNPHLWQRNWDQAHGWTFGQPAEAVIRQGMGPVSRGYAEVLAARSAREYERMVMGAFGIPPCEMAGPETLNPVLPTPSFESRCAERAERLFRETFPDFNDNRFGIRSKKDSRVTYLFEKDHAGIKMFYDDKYLGWMCISVRVKHHIPKHDGLFQFALLLQQGQEDVILKTGQFHIANFVEMSDLFDERDKPGSVRKMEERMLLAYSIILGLGGHHHPGVPADGIRVEKNGRLTVSKDTHEELEILVGERERRSRPLVGSFAEQYPMPIDPAEIIALVEEING